MTDEATEIGLEVMIRVIEKIQDYILRFQDLEVRVDRLHEVLFAHLDPRVTDALQCARKEASDENPR